MVPSASARFFSIAATSVRRRHTDWGSIPPPQGAGRMEDISRATYIKSKILSIPSQKGKWHCYQKTNKWTKPSQKKKAGQWHHFNKGRNSKQGTKMNVKKAIQANAKLNTKMNINMNKYQYERKYEYGHEHEYKHAYGHKSESRGITMVSRQSQRRAIRKLNLCHSI